MKKLCFAIAIVVGVFLLPCVSAAAEHEDTALYFMRMINDARKFPAKALQGIGADPAVAKANMGVNAWILDQGLPPVAWNDQLHSSALAHAGDMVANIYYAYESLDGTSVEERISATGYLPLYTGESLGILAFDKYIPPIRAAEIMLANMLYYEIGSTIASENRNILSEDPTEVGIAFISAMVDLGLGVPVNIYLVVADFATPGTPRSFIIGNVFGKTIFKPVNQLENGLPGLKIDVKDLASNTTFEYTTRANGFFQFPMSDRFMTLDIWDETRMNLLVRRSYFTQSQNILLDVFVDK